MREPKALTVHPATRLAPAAVAPAPLAGDAEEALAVRLRPIGPFDARDFDNSFAHLSDGVEAFIGVQSPGLVQGSAATGNGWTTTVTVKQDGKRSIAGFHRSSCFWVAFQLAVPDR